MRNFILSFTIVAIAIALLFTACQKDIEQETVTNGDLSALLTSKISPEEWSPILLPQDLAPGQESLYQFIEGLSEEDLRTRMETYRIYNVIKQSDNLSKLYEAEPNFEVLTEADLQKYALEALKNLSAFEDKSSDLGNYTFNNVGGVPTVGVPNIPGLPPGGCNDCDCDILSVDCHGTTLIVTQKCCSICLPEFIPFYNHHLCAGNDPCHGIDCDSDEECIDGECVPLDPCEGVPCPEGEHCEDGECVTSPPCHGVECPFGEICIDGECVPKCDPPCPKNQHCISGECVEL